eukprot:22301_4
MLVVETPLLLRLRLKAGFIRGEVVRTSSWGWAIRMQRTSRTKSPTFVAFQSAYWPGTTLQRRLHRKQTTSISANSSSPPNPTS